ncbi:MAG: asparagine synthase (glutamine-hydrolyzing) [Candidatus Omnitrophica bacterium]|nr:asparagine synthase (glutamine-hydrolyzing) [Candidatus Omnitrophota bacterium]
MCGICGFVRFGGKIENGTAEKMLSPLAHRGPDDEGIFVDNDRAPFLLLGHRRLSVIDLEGGHQPLSDETGNFWCVHNGEIYNFPELKNELEGKGYVFRTHSDTEVIANMYRFCGSECVRKLNGMFAFCVWDKKERTLFLARDRIGIKPVYYYFDGDNFIFSSSIKSFLGIDFVKKEVDSEALSEYLQYLYINAPRSIFKSIRKLEPGSCIKLREKSLTVTRYWDAVEIIKSGNDNIVSNENECVEKIKSLLADSVKMRLISDVPLGVFLSGGVDSSIITSLAVKGSGKKVNTFSVTFKGKGYYDESRFARKVSRLFETEHREIEIEPDLGSELGEIISLLDEPFADSSFVPAFYLSKFTRRFVKVALSGTGGDDIFAGYRRYAVGNAIKMLERSPGFIKKALPAVANNIFPTRKNRMGEKAILARRLFAAMEKDEERRHGEIMSFITRDMQRELLLVMPEAPEGTRDTVLSAYRLFDDGYSYVNRALYADFISYLGGDLLVKEDQATMAVALEGRVPFLDHRLAEYSFRIDPRLKLRGFTTKYILKKAFEDALPRDILYREKHGFAFPISEYLRGDFSDVAEDILLSRKNVFFNNEAIKDMLNSHREGKSDFGQHLWALLVFNLWHDKYAK